jgi:hypothetical protein
MLGQLNMSLLMPAGVDLPSSIYDMPFVWVNTQKTMDHPRLTDRSCDEPRPKRSLIRIRPLNPQARRHFPAAVHAERETGPL